MNNIHMACSLLTGAAIGVIIGVYIGFLFESFDE